MQKIIMLSEKDGCIFTSPVSELVLHALLGKSKAGIIDSLYYVDLNFYMAFRADYEGFQQEPTLVAFIQANMDKTILVADFTNQKYPLKIVEQSLIMLKLINQGVQQSEVLKQLLLL